MKLNRKQVLQLAQASNGFINSYNSNKDKIHLSASARMIIELNGSEVSKDFELISEKEKEIAGDNFGLLVGSLGYQFFNSEEDLNNFKDKLQDFQKEIESSYSIKDQEKRVKKIQSVLSKYLENTSNDNRMKFIEDWSSFLEDEDGVREFKVKPIKVSWFDNTDSDAIDDLFYNNYRELNLIEY